MDGSLTTSTAKQSGSVDWIERLFARLLAMYGSQWLDRWRDAPMELVKAEWKDALSRFDLLAIKGGLDWCRDNAKYPPSLPEFMDACRQARARPEHQPVPRLEGTTTRGDPKVREEIANLAERLRGNRPLEPLDCFRQIIKEAEEGTYANWYGLKTAREALGIVPDA